MALKETAHYIPAADCVLYINNQKNTCVTVNRIRVALKETAHYIPAADCVLYINNQTNTCVTVNWIRASLKVTAHYIPAATVCFILIIKYLCNSKLDPCGS